MDWSRDCYLYTIAAVVLRETEEKGRKMNASNEPQFLFRGIFLLSVIIIPFILISFDFFLRNRAPISIHVGLRVLVVIHCDSGGTTHNKLIEYTTALSFRYTEITS